jgi:hypothetical protein
MKSKKKSSELDVDYIQSKPLTKAEALALSAFIKKLKSQNKVDSVSSRKIKKQIAA